MKKPYLMLLALIGAPLAAQTTNSGRADAFPKPQGTELQVLEKDIQAELPLTLTRHPDGGDVVARIAQGESVQIVLTESGHYLLKTAFGLTGWLQDDDGGAADGLDKLKTRTLDIDGAAAYTLHYNANVAKEINRQQPDSEDSDIILHDLLTTPLAKDGKALIVRCSTGVPNDMSYCAFLKNDADNDPVVLFGNAFHIPANGYVYSDYHDTGASYYRHYSKWQWTDGAFREVEQPYRYIGADGIATGMLELRTKADGGNLAGSVAKGSKVRVILADPHQPCPSDFAIADGAICDSATILIRDEKGQTGWTTIRYAEGSDNPPPTIESEAMGGLAG